MSKVYLIQIKMEGTEGYYPQAICSSPEEAMECINKICDLLEAAVKIDNGSVIITSKADGWRRFIEIEGDDLNANLELFATEYELDEIYDSKVSSLLNKEGV